jgi:hypothetical protein
MFASARSPLNKQVQVRQPSSYGLCTPKTYHAFRVEIVGPFSVPVVGGSVVHRILLATSAVAQGVSNDAVAVLFRVRYKENGESDSKVRRPFREGPTYRAFELLDSATSDPLRVQTVLGRRFAADTVKQAFVVLQHGEN